MNIRTRGFTIVELIVVIVVIGILAGVGIIGYGAWRNQTTANVLKSDLAGVSAAMEDSRNFSDTGYPSTIPTSFEPSPNTEISPGALNDAYRYCVTSRSTTNPDIIFSINNISKTPRAGDCTVQVGTFAGSGSATYSNGSSTSGGLPGPSGITIRQDGSFVISEISGHRVRTIGTDGMIGLLAGSGTVGYLEGTSTAARFNNPNSAVEDSSGNVYVADGSNHRIRKIAPDGQVTTFAGTGTAGGANTANPLTSTFNTPHGIIIGKDGSFYISETGGHRIRKISPSGVVTTIAGSGIAGYVEGTGTAARFNAPYAMVIDNDQNLYVTDYSNQRIRKVTQAGVVTTFAGTGIAGSIDGPAATASFHGPFGITMDKSGSMYVVTRLSNSIRRINPKGEVTTLAGNATAGFVNGLGANARFNAPRGIIAADDGTLYVADYGNRRIRSITF